MKIEKIVLILMLTLSGTWGATIYAKEQAALKCELYNSNELEELEASSKEALIAENWVWQSIFPSGSHNGSIGGYARCRIINFEEDITADDIEFIVLGPSRGKSSKFNIYISSDAVTWTSIGYVQSAGTGKWEKILIRSEDIIQDESFKCLKIQSAGSQYIDGVRVYGQIKQASRMIGIEHEQTVDIDDNTSLPKIIEVKAEIEDQTTNTYKLSIEDFKCDVNGIPFFFWKADEVMFIGANEDYTEVRCIIDEGISGRKVPVKVYIGDALGHIGKYTVWLSSN